MTLINSNVAPGQEVRSQKSVHADQGFEFGPGSELNEDNDILTWAPPQGRSLEFIKCSRFIEFIKPRSTCIWSEVCMLTPWPGARREFTV